MHTLMLTWNAVISGAMYTMPRKLTCNARLSTPAAPMNPRDRLINGEIWYTKPLALTDGDCQLAAKKLSEFLGQLNCKLLGILPNAAMARQLQIFDRPNEHDYLN
jgi:hypothetical protein